MGVTAVKGHHKTSHFLSLTLQAGHCYTATQLTCYALNFASHLTHIHAKIYIQFLLL